MALLRSASLRASLGAFRAASVLPRALPNLAAPVSASWFLIHSLVSLVWQLKFNPLTLNRKPYTLNPKALNPKP